MARPRVLTNEQVRALRAAYAAGATYRELAAAYGVSHPTVAFIIQGRTYTDVPSTVRPRPRSARRERRPPAATAAAPLAAARGARQRQRAERNARLRQGRAAGQTLFELATREGLSESAVSLILAGRRGQELAEKLGPPEKNSF